MRQDKLLEFWFAQLDGNYFVDRLFSLFCGLSQVYFCPVMISYYGSDPNHYRLHLIFQNLQPVQCERGCVMKSLRHTMLKFKNAASWPTVVLVGVISLSVIGIVIDAS